MFGLIAILILTSTFIFNSKFVASTSIKEHSVQLKGGLIFKEEGLAQINQDFIQFVRRLDNSALIELSSKAKDSIAIYEAFCTVIKNLNLRAKNNLNSNQLQDEDPLKYIVTIIEHPISESTAICNGIGARKPEIRDSRQWGKLRDFAVQHKVKLIAAGIYYDDKTETFRFNTDDSKAKIDGIFDKISYGGSYTDKYHDDHWTSRYVKGEAMKFPIIYQDPQSKFILRIADRKQIATRQLIICEQIVQPNTTRDIGQNKFLLSAESACQHNLNPLKKSTEFTIRELQAITTLNFSLVQETTQWDTYVPVITEPTNYNNTLERTKRAYPIIMALGGIAAGATIGVLASQAINLQRAQEFSPDEHTMSLYRAYAKHINDVQINQNEMKSTITMVNNRMTQFEQQIIGNFEGSQAMQMENNLKDIIRHQQALVQITMLKYNQILSSASFGKTSPYVLSSPELNEQALKTLKEENLLISDNLEEVICYTSIKNNEIQFILQVPIKDQAKQFRLFTITPIPTFMDNSTYLPQLDSNHIAINSQGDKYTVLNDLELNRCLDTPPDCRSTRPIAPIREETSCAAVTYTTDQQKCPYSDVHQKPTTFVRFFDMFMFYSAPTEQKIYIQCATTRTQADVHDVITIKGIGVTTVHHSCDITLPDGSTHRTPRIPSTINLAEKLFQEVRNIPTPQKENALIRDKTIFSHISFEKTKITDFNDMITQAFHPAKTISTALIMIIIIVIILIFFIVTCKWTPSLYTKPLRYLTGLQSRIYARGLPPRQEWYPDMEEMSTIPKQKPIIRHHHTPNCDRFQERDDILDFTSQKNASFETTASAPAYHFNNPPPIPPKLHSGYKETQFLDTV